MACEAVARNHLERMLLDESIEAINLPISLLASITNNFSDDQHIGEGGFAVVYKGTLQNGSVAVKKLSKKPDLDDAKFIKELACLMKVKHNNIVRFLGYCADAHGKMLHYNGKIVIADDRERLLCFEFVQGGALDKHITDPSQGLEWRIRYRIIKGICEGLHYLHQEHNIVHLDLKPANILLDNNMVPKIADFGISRCFDGNQTRTITSHIFGSDGYMAPESYGGLITLKSDIYSLGIIIIEILTGHKDCADIEKVIDSWSHRFKTSKGDTLLEPIRVCAGIGIECANINREMRPSTRCIIDRLNEMELKYGFMKTDLFTLSAKNCDGKVKLEIMGRVKSIQSTTPANNFAVLVRVTAPLRTTRVGLDLVAVIDVRGKNRMDSMRQAMMFIIDNLGLDDRLAIVSSKYLVYFWYEELKLSIMSDVNREKARQVVKELEPQRIFDTGDAMNRAAQILRERGQEERSNRVGRIFFLSDGCDDSIVGQKISREFPVEAFGLGANHNPVVLQYIANRTMGLYSYVSQDIEKMKCAFAQSLGGLMSVTAMDVQVSLQALHNVTISSIQSGSCPNRIDYEKQSGMIHIKDLYVGEQKNFIVYLAVPQGQQSRLLTVSGSYSNPWISERSIKLDDSTLAVMRPYLATTPSDRTVCTDVAAEIIRLRLMEHVSATVERPNRDGLLRSWKDIKASEDGRSTLGSKMLALDKEVEEICRGPLPFMLSWLTSHGLQRATTKGLPSKSFGYRVKVMEEMIKKADAEQNPSPGAVLKRMYGKQNHLF